MGEWPLLRLSPIVHAARRAHVPGGKRRPAAVALAPPPAVKPPVQKRRRPPRPGTDASRDHRNAHTRGNDLPWVLRAPALADPAAAAHAPTDRLACCVYCDDTMFTNALLAVGSFRRFAPARGSCSSFGTRPNSPGSATWNS